MFSKIFTVSSFSCSLNKAATAQNGLNFATKHKHSPKSFKKKNHFCGKYNIILKQKNIFFICSFESKMFGYHCFSWARNSDYKRWFLHIILYDNFLYILLVFLQTAYHLKLNIRFYLLGRSNNFSVSTCILLSKMKLLKLYSK